EHRRSTVRRAATTGRGRWPSCLRAGASAGAMSTAAPTRTACNRPATHACPLMCLQPFSAPWASPPTTKSQTRPAVPSISSAKGKRSKNFWRDGDVTRSDFLVPKLRWGTQVQKLRFESTYRCEAELRDERSQAELGNERRTRVVLRCVRLFIEYD